LAILVCVSFTALFAPWLAPHDPFEQQLLDRRQPPSIQHPLGLDELGRDNLSRIIYGARLSLRVGVTSVLLALAAGGLLGALAGYRGGWLDSLIMSLMDVMQAFPTLLLAIAVIVVLGRGLSNVLYAVAFTAIPTYARLMRVGVLVAKEREYVLAARAVGVSSGRLLWRHILPGCVIPLQVQAMLGIGTAILETAGLSFLGLGAQPPTSEWGAMLGQGRGAVFAAPHIVLFPGLAIMLTVLGFNLLGDGLRDLSDPKSM
jgi:ABC-type dipeptide/oligopeptide/nickel transport system permease subunit